MYTRVEVEGEGCNFQLNLISDELAAHSARSSASNRSMPTSIEWIARWQPSTP